MRSNALAHVLGKGDVRVQDEARGIVNSMDELLALEAELKAFHDAVQEAKK